MMYKVYLVIPKLGLFSRNLYSCNVVITYLKVMRRPNLVLHMDSNPNRMPTARNALHVM